MVIILKTPCNFYTGRFAYNFGVNTIIAKFIIPFSEDLLGNT